MKDNSVSLAFEPNSTKLILRVYTSIDIEADSDLLIKEIHLNLPNKVWNCIVEIEG